MTSMLRELLHHLSAPRLYDQSFGLGLDKIPNSSSSPSTLSPLWTLVHCPTNINEKLEFQVSLDVQQFKPEELNVDIKGDSVVVTGKHEEKKDQHGFISRQFTRRYQLPETIDSDTLKASLSSDGVLQLSATLRSTPTQEVNIPIINTKETAAALHNVSSETATVLNGDAKTTSVNGEAKTASVNGDTKTASVNGDNNPSPTNSPVSKKPRIEVGN